MIRRKFIPASIRRIVILAAAVLPLLGVAAQGAHARSDRYTRGDAESLLSTYPVNDGHLEDGLDVRPFPNYNQSPLCVDDWHLLAFAYWEGELDAPAIPLTLTRRDVWWSLGQAEAQFFLDGAPIELERTSLTAIRDNGERADYESLVESIVGVNVTVGTLWGFQWGRIMPPGDLPVGAHTFTVNYTVFPGGFPINVSSQGTFEVGGPDSAACTA